MRALRILELAGVRDTIKRIPEQDRVSESTRPRRRRDKQNTAARRERRSAGLSREKRNGSMQAAELKAFRVEIFALRNDISRSQAFKEIKAGRLTALKCGSRTLITAQAEKAWQDALPRVIPNADGQAGNRVAAERLRPEQTSRLGGRVTPARSEAERKLKRQPRTHQSEETC